MTPRNFVFVLTPIDVLDGIGTELAPGHPIEKATPTQVARIKELLSQFNDHPWAIPPYEHDIRPVQGDSPGNITFHHEALPPERWRYWVVNFTGPNSELGELEFACGLSPQDVELGFHVMYWEGLTEQGSVGWNAAKLHTFFHSGVDREQPKAIHEGDLIRIRTDFDNIKRLPPKHSHIHRALRRFEQLRWLPRSSEMVVLGLFSVIESLVCHAPKLTESSDSLSHQLVTKLPMLRKRFHPDLDHSTLFLNLPEDKLWKKLYAYRSKIVHGEDADVSRDLASLRSVGSVISFLRETSKRLLRLSLTEFELMSDLKEC